MYCRSQSSHHRAVDYKKIRRKKYTQKDKRNKKKKVKKMIVKLNSLFTFIRITELRLTYVK